MSSADHPTYPNPIIQEALCEIYFRLPEDSPFNPTWYGDFYRGVQEQFPIILPTTAPQFKLDVSQSIGPKPVLFVPQIMQYRNANDTVVLQLTDDRIVISVLPDYPGWKQVKEYINYAWEKFCEVAEPSEILRVGLRYINRIDRRDDNETLGDWLKPNDYIPSVVLSAQASFTSRIEVEIDEHEALLITVTDREVSPGRTNSYTFDIDYGLSRPSSVDKDLLLDEVTRLHEKIWEVFRSAKGDKLEQLLQGEIL